jgi:hypothetical protein
MKPSFFSQIGAKAYEALFGQLFAAPLCLALAAQANASALIG